MNGQSQLVAIKKRHRTIHNPMADIDSVDEAPGQSYINWIMTTRTKLQERESNLLRIRMNLVKRVIYETIQEFNADQANNQYGVNIAMTHIDSLFQTISEEQIRTTIEYLNGILSQWNGVDLTRSTKKFTSFRKYFVVSKNWFDHRKKSVLTEHFWLRILCAIQQFSVNVGASIGYNRQNIECTFGQYVLFKVLHNIFNSKTQFSSTKPQPLIPGGTIKDTIDIRHFLQSVNESLSLTKLYNESSSAKNKDISAKQTLSLILKQLNILTVQYCNAFHSALTCFDQNVNVPIPNMVPNPIPNMVPNIPNLPMQYCNPNNYSNIIVNNGYNNFGIFSGNDPVQNPMDFSSNDTITNYTPNDSPLMMKNGGNAFSDAPPRQSFKCEQKITNPFLPNINNHNSANVPCNPMLACTLSNNSLMSSVTNVSAPIMAMNEMPNINSNSHMNNMNNGINFVDFGTDNTYNYGSMHSSNVYVSQNRHNPLSYYPSHDSGINQSNYANHNGCTCCNHCMQ